LAAHPGLEMELILDDRVIDLVEEGIDVSFRMGDLADSSATARRLATSRRIVLGTPAYFTIAGAPTTPADLAAHEAIIYTQGRAGTWEFERSGSRVSVMVRGRLRASSAEGVRAAVCSHLGLTIASTWMFSPELASGAVRQVLEDWILPAIDLWAVYPTGRLASAKARAFVDFVASRIAVRD
jgi:DNA-binding transcriptional LysR family regulator